LAREAYAAISRSKGVIKKPYNHCWLKRRKNGFAISQEAWWNSKGMTPVKRVYVPEPFDESDWEKTMPAKRATKKKRSTKRGSTGKPPVVPSEQHAPGDPRRPLIEGSWIWCPLKGEWRVLLPEERVRQQFILILHERYRYEFEQMDQERRTKHGRKSPKADIAVWGSLADKNDGKAPIVVIECKSDNVTIDPDDYDQGDSYARAIGDPCEFLVMHNNKETRFFRIIRGLPGSREDLESIPSREDIGQAKRMQAIRRATKAFSRDEFRRLLFDCHCILRDNHKMEPGKAFDEISKILFVKMYIERSGYYEKFTTTYLEEYARIRRRKQEEVMHDLFDDTKTHYATDALFGSDDRLNISFATFLRIVKLLARFNLGATSDDVKGIAFERFLGQTFRGDLGQFFTPRPIVDFMVDLMDPKEDDVMCDPASGSGGFLIHHFEHVRGQIERDVHDAKQARRAEIEAKSLPAEDEAAAIETAFSDLNTALDVTIEGSRLWNIAHKAIFGCDAEPRAARTSKMNMIMHGDGHGGIHHHDGLVDVNGIFPGRFDIVLTNPPFGATVKDDQIVGATPETRVDLPAASVKAYRKRFGKPYELAYQRMKKAEENKESVLSLFDISKNAETAKTEVLFLERCIDLLKPSGKLGIVVPDGVLNNPSLVDLRNSVEDRARLLAVISIPDKTFKSAKTNVKASLLFVQRYTGAEERERNRLRESRERRERKKRATEVERLEALLKVTWKDYSRRVLHSQRPLTAKNLKLALTEYGKKIPQSEFEAKRTDLRERYRELVAAPAALARAAVKKKFDYDIFMALAEHVGIRASGKVDPANELPGVLDAWRKFAAAPRNISNDVSQAVFKVKWSAVDRWDPSSFKPIPWECDPSLLRPLGNALVKRCQVVDRDEFDFSELTPVTIHFDGSVDPRDMSDTDDYTMTLYFARTGDVVVSKIDLKNGAVGVIPGNLENVVFTNHFVVYQPDLDVVHPPYLMRLIQSPFFKDYLWRKKVGSEGRKEVKIDLFESTPIPLPDVKEQQRIVGAWEKLEQKRREVEAELEIEDRRLGGVLIAGGQNREEK